MKKGMIMLLGGVVFVMGLSVSLSQLKPIFTPQIGNKVILLSAKS